MSHRFSNSSRIRTWVKANVEDLHGMPYQKWEDIPQPLRVLILEHIYQCIEEVLNGKI